MVNLRIVPIFLLLLQGVVHGQVLSPTVIATAGGSTVAGGVQLDQTIGEPVYTLFQTNEVHMKQGFQQTEPLRLRLDLHALLQGPYVQTSGMMSDALRSAGYLPMSEPYTALGFPAAGGGGEHTSSAALSVTGTSAVVDWVHLQLRAASSNTSIISTRNALLHRDGSVTDVDGTSAVAFAAPAGSYFLSVHHRDHLGVMTASPVALSASATSVDLISGATPVFGTAAQKTVGAVRLSWSGDVNGDGALKYTGIANDRDQILLNIGGTTPNNTTSGYQREDVNMDGIVKYTGLSNDRDLILLNIGGTTPNNVRQAQLP